MIFSAVTDIGKKRSSNQDSCHVGGNWCVVADGMGGHNGGKVASQTAVEVITKFIESEGGSEAENCESLLRRAIAAANAEIFAMSLSDPTLDGMGTTAVLCRFTEGMATVAHAGDSRAYLIGAEGIVQITHDHSIVQQLIESGTITPLEAKTHPHKNLITRAIGTELHIEVDLTEIAVKKGDRILLCTDGLTAFLADDEIEDVIRKHDIDTAAAELVSRANDAGGADNITVVIAEI